MYSMLTFNSILEPKFPRVPSNNREKEAVTKAPNFELGEKVD